MVVYDLGVLGNFGTHEALVYFKIFVPKTCWFFLYAICNLGISKHFGTENYT